MYMYVSMRTRAVLVRCRLLVHYDGTIKQSLMYTSSTELKIIFKINIKKNLGTT